MSPELDTRSAKSRRKQQRKTLQENVEYRIAHPETGPFYLDLRRIVEQVDRLPGEERNRFPILEISDAATFLAFGFAIRDVSSARSVSDFFGTMMKFRLATMLTPAMADEDGATLAAAVELWLNEGLSAEAIITVFKAMAYSHALSDPPVYQQLAPAKEFADPNPLYDLTKTFEAFLEWMRPKEGSLRISETQARMAQIYISLKNTLEILRTVSAAVAGNVSIEREKGGRLRLAASGFPTDIFRLAPEAMIKVLSLVAEEDLAFHRLSPGSFASCPARERDLFCADSAVKIAFAFQRSTNSKEDISALVEAIGRINTGLHARHIARALLEAECFLGNYLPENDDPMLKRWGVDPSAIKARMRIPRLDDFLKTLSKPGRSQKLFLNLPCLTTSSNPAHLNHLSLIAATHFLGEPSVPVAVLVGLKVTHKEPKDSLDGKELHGKSFLAREGSMKLLIRGLSALGIPVIMPTYNQPRFESVNSIVERLMATEQSLAGAVERFYNGSVSAQVEFTRIIGTDELGRPTTEMEIGRYLPSQEPDEQARTALHKMRHIIFTREDTVAMMIFGGAEKTLEQFPQGSVLVISNERAVSSRDIRRDLRSGGKQWMRWVPLSTWEGVKRDFMKDAP